MNEIEQIKEMILACDSNLKVSYYFDENFSMVFKVLFW